MRVICAGAIPRRSHRCLHALCHLSDTRCASESPPARSRICTIDIANTSVPQPYAFHFQKPSLFFYIFQSVFSESFNLTGFDSSVLFYSAFEFHTVPRRRLLVRYCFCLAIENVVYVQLKMIVLP